MSQSRREFIQKAGCGALSLATLASGVQNLGLVNAFAQKNIQAQGNVDIVPNAFADYKALVCLFFFGGMDMNNVVIPNHNDANISNYAAYAAARNNAGLAIPQNQLRAIAVPRLNNLSYGFHPSLPAFQTLYNARRLAVLSNVGPLIFPMTRAQFQNNSVRRPRALFSHDDQTNQYQSARADAAVNVGWGGKVADVLRPQDATALIPMITSINGSQLFTQGNVTKPLAVGTGNLNIQLALNGFDTGAPDVARRNAMNTLRTLDVQNNVIKAASGVMDGAVQASQALNSNPALTTVFPNSGLGNQLRQVARMISLRNALSITRQVFFVGIGNNDTHTGQVGSQANTLNTVNAAVEAFWNCINTELNIANGVTLFTSSDFSRTLIPNDPGGNVGTDHAWGSHQFILGGAVSGGNFYGSTRPDGTGNVYPTLAPGGPDDLDGGGGPRGRWIPTTSVDQYAATLATWFGVAPGDLDGIFPNLRNFSSRNLGFMA